MLNSLEPTGVLDLGAFETKFIIFSINNSKVKILSKFILKTQGIKRGAINDLDKLSNTIKEIIGKAEDQAKIEIKNVYLAPNPANLKNTSFTFFKNIGGYEIEREKDIQFLINGAVNLFRELNLNYNIIHLINSNLRIDKYNIVENPTGLVADSLESDMHIVYCKNNSIKNFQKIISKTYLQLNRLIYSPYVLGYHGFKESPLSENIMVIDFGHEKTSISIFKNDNFQFASTIPVGSWHLTNDISKALNLNIEIAENLKINYGCCNPEINNLNQEYLENENIDFKSYKKVSNKILNKIIIYRIEEIIDFINRDLIFYSLNEKFFNKIIITGEGSKIKGFENLLKKKLQIRSLVFENLSSKLKNDLSDKFDVCISMINYILNPYRKEIPSHSNTKKNFFEFIYSLFS